jgi:hypothetical protein
VLYSRLEDDNERRKDDDEKTTLSPEGTGCRCENVEYVPARDSFTSDVAGSLSIPSGTFDGPGFDLCRNP